MSCGNASQVSQLWQSNDLARSKEIAPIQKIVTTNFGFAGILLLSLRPGNQQRASKSRLKYHRITLETSLMHRHEMEWKLEELWGSMALINT